jgi:hypothetical protein
LEFARYWFAALDWGYATTDSTLAKTLFLPQCKDCTRFMRNFDGPKAHHEHFSGGRSTITSNALIEGDTTHPGATVVDVTINVSALKTLDSKDHVISKAPPVHSFVSRLWLRWSDQKWAVLDSKQVVDK